MRPLGEASMRPSRDFHKTSMILLWELYEILLDSHEICMEILCTLYECLKEVSKESHESPVSLLWSSHNICTGLVEVL